MGSVCARGEARLPWSRGCSCSLRALSHSHTAAELEGTLPTPSNRFHLFTVVLALHTGSAVSQTHPPTRVRGCSAHLCQKAMGKYRIQALPSATLVYKENDSSLTDRHLAGQQTGYSFQSPPHCLGRVTWS